MNKTAEYAAPKAQSLLSRAGEALQETTGLRLDVENSQAARATAEAYFNRDSGKRYGPWHVQIKRTLPQQSLTSLAAQLKRAAASPTLLVTEYVNPRQADTLRELGIAFIDAAGNAFLQKNADLLIYVAGRPKSAGYNPRQQRAAFRPTELKLILLFLCDAEALTATYRELAERADIALGNVAQTVKTLEAQRFIVRPTKRERRLLNRRELIDRWVADYIARLRPTLKLGHYDARRPHWWHDVTLEAGEGRWGGEVAAAHWTQYLKAATATIYVESNPAKLLLKQGLVKNPQGDTEILMRFWPADLEVEQGYVPPIVAYADLLAIGGARNVETATELFETRLAAYYKEA